MRWNEISQPLLEFNVGRIVRDFGEKVMAKVKRDTSAPKELETAEQIIDAIGKFDPTPNKEYTFWLVGAYVRDGVRRWEDFGSRAEPLLIKHLRLKRTRQLPVEARDINRIKSLSELSEIISQVSTDDKDTMNAKDWAAQTRKTSLEDGTAVIHYEGNGVKIIIPKTKEASQAWGFGTEWCTAYPDDPNRRVSNLFDSYNRVGPLFIIIHGQERWQLHFDKTEDPRQEDNTAVQIMDVKDDPVSPLDLARKFPFLVGLFDPFLKYNHTIYFKSKILGADIDYLCEVDGGEDGDYGPYPGLEGDLEDYCGVFADRMDSSAINYAMTYWRSARDGIAAKLSDEQVVEFLVFRSKYNSPSGPWINGERFTSEIMKKALEINPYQIMKMIMQAVQSTLNQKFIDRIQPHWDELMTLAYDEAQNTDKHKPAFNTTYPRIRQKWSWDDVQAFNAYRRDHGASGTGGAKDNWLNRGKGTDLGHLPRSS